MVLMQGYSGDNALFLPYNTIRLESSHLSKITIICHNARLLYFYIIPDLDFLCIA